MNCRNFSPGGSFSFFVLALTTIAAARITGDLKIEAGQDHMSASGRLGTINGLVAIKPNIVGYSETPDLVN